MDTASKDDLTHLEKNSQTVTADQVDDIQLVQNGIEAEKNMTLMEGLKKYPKAVMWSALVSTSIIMEGYDIVLIFSLWAQPAFTKKYGSYDPVSQSYQLSAAWQAGLSNAVGIGTIIGAFLNGYLTHKFGYRKVLLTSLLAITVFIFVTFFAPNVSVLLVGEILCGIPWGVFATMAPAYASEVCPTSLRGYLSVYVNLCWALGQLIAAGVLQGVSGLTTQWAYRIPFGIQWMWPIPLALILFFAPESPWWLVRVGRLDEAERSLQRLSSVSDAGHTKQSLAFMVHTNSLEKEIDKGTSYLDCFKGVDLRRTEIACIAFAAQPFCGSAMGGTPTYFFTQAGLPVSISFKMSVGGLGLAAVGTLVSWKLMHSFGRRTLYLVGLGALTVILLCVGFVSVGAKNSTGGDYAQATLMLMWLFVYYMTVGPICYAIISESSSTRLRNKSVCLSRITYYIAQIITNVVNPYMLNPTQGDWKGKTGFFWGGFSFLFFVWTWFRLPEMKNRTFEELDILFFHKVKTREFANYKVDAFTGDRGTVIKT